MKNVAVLRETRSNTLAAWLLRAFCLALVLTRVAGAQSVLSLPVYEVTEDGITAAQAKKLAEAFHIPTGRLKLSDGAASYVDPDKYVVVPSVPVSDPIVVAQMHAPSSEKFANASFQARAIDFAALQALRVLETPTAFQISDAAFAAAGLHLESARPQAGHTKLTVSSNSAAADGSTTFNLDTKVTYALYAQGGHPFIGPGSMVQVSYDGAGDVIQLQYAVRSLRQGPAVSVFSEDEARRRVAAKFPANAQINVQLVYWCPPLGKAVGQGSKRSPRFIIPFYAYNSVDEVTNPATGAVSQRRSKVQLIPATDDPRFVPVVQLTARGGERVEAEVEVRGGRAPYTYLWSGSNPLASNQAGSTISYQPITREPPTAGSTSVENLARLRSETVGVAVMDADGVIVEANLTVGVIAHVVPIFKGSLPTPGYGTESPREPDFALGRMGWQEGMGTPGVGGGQEVFAWLGNLAWPGDFIEPKPPGALLQQPWIHGDADYSNWGVNSATIVLNNTDGWPVGFDSSEPGAAIDQYPTAELYIPSATDPTVVTGLLNGSTTGSTLSSPINYNGSWTPIGPNDQLLWLAQDSCDTLDDGKGLLPVSEPPAQRWGPAFGGLHIMTGFNSSEQLGDGTFEKDFAQNMLGVSGPPQQIVQAWFTAAETMGNGVPAAIGPITIGNVSDVNDYYLGKGSQGPSIEPAAITGWWFLTD